MEIINELLITTEAQQMAFMSKIEVEWACISLSIHTAVADTKYWGGGIFNMYAEGVSVSV
jgi:hypothetical protein